MTGFAIPLTRDQIIVAERHVLAPDRIGIARRHGLSASRIMQIGAKADRRAYLLRWQLARELGWEHPARNLAPPAASEVAIQTKRSPALPTIGAHRGR